MKIKNLFFKRGNWKWTIAIAVVFVSCSDTKKSSVELKTAPGKDAQFPADKQFTRLPNSYTGLNFSNQLGEDIHGRYNVLTFPYYYNGAGVAIGDINNDGLPDVMMTGNTVSNRLYLNKGDMQFEDITEKAGLKTKDWSTGATMADVNNDGYLDIYVCLAGPNPNDARRANLMYINNGDMTFTEKGAEMGIDDYNRSTQASFFDYDNDGDMDLYVADYSLYSRVSLKQTFENLKIEKNLRDASGRMYRNDGNLKFTEVTKEAGLLKYGYGLGLVTSDFNHDGWIDIYVANDFNVPDYMYINNGDGTFTDQTNNITQQISFDGMGCDIADFNNDGMLDIAVVDMTETDHVMNKTTMANMDQAAYWSYINNLHYQHQYMFNSLQMNRGDGTFSNVANAVGLGSSDWSWTALFADFDNDGWKDFLVTNGYRRYVNDKDFRITLKKEAKNLTKQKKEELFAMIPQKKLRNYVYRNSGNLQFEDLSKEWGMDDLSYSNGASYADLDNDGDLDVIVNNIDDKAFVYRNNANEKNNNNFLRVKLEGKNSAALLNAKINLYYKDGIQFQEYTPTRGYQSSIEHMVHFGLGKNTMIDSLRVEWVDGKTQLLTSVPTNQVLVLDKSNALGKSAPKRGQEETYVSALQSNKYGLNFKHKENHYDDFAVEVLLPHKQSALGPFAGVGDVNGDGLDDFYAGGAAGQSGILYVQDKQGKFKVQKGPWSKDSASEDMSSIFFDVDNDGDMDLYVASGGSADVKNQASYQDRLYLNSGNGTFVKTKNWLPKMETSTLRVKAFDYDGDGRQDLIVGGRLIPEKYPYPARTYLLKNTGKAFKDVTAKSPDLKTPGLINDILCTDFNKDGKVDLVMAGEWTSIRFFENQKGTFTDVSKNYLDKEKTGWWYSLALYDVDNDGDKDIIAGNLGLNNKFHASEKKPLGLYSNDFDGNGTCDVVLSKKYKGKKVPVRGKQCSTEQMPFISEKFPTFHEFANASLEDLYGNGLSNALHVEATDFRSYVFINEGGKYVAKALPNEAQIAPLNASLVRDWTGDGNPDILIAGNMFDVEVETPRYDAGFGLLLQGDGQGNFHPLSMSESGFVAAGNVKDLKLVRGQHEDKIIVMNNDDKIQLFKVKKKGRLIAGN